MRLPGLWFARLDCLSHFSAVETGNEMLFASAIRCCLLMRGPAEMGFRLAAKGHLRYRMQQRCLGGV